MMTEEAARIRHAAEEICDQIGEGEILQGAEQYLHYFYPETVSFLEYRPENSRIFLDEPNRIIECADALEAEFQESVSHRLEKGYLLPGQAKLIDVYKRQHADSKADNGYVLEHASHAAAV